MIINSGDALALTGTLIGSWEQKSQEAKDGLAPKISLDSFKFTCGLACAGFVTLFLIYSMLRCQTGLWSTKLFAPRIFTARSAPKALPRSMFGWIKSLLGKRVSTRILDEVGLDAFMFDRVLVCCVCVFAVFVPFSVLIMMPLYYQLNSPVKNAELLDRFTLNSDLALGNFQNAIWIIVAMTYWNSIVVLYFLYAEYQNYVYYCRIFMRQRAQHNHTVLVERIPKKLFNEPALMHYFRKIFGNLVLSVEMVEDNPVLNYAVKRRLDVVRRLERANFELHRTSRRPSRLFFPWLCGQLKLHIESLRYKGAESNNYSSTMQSSVHLGGIYDDSVDHDVDEAGDIEDYFNASDDEADIPSKIIPSNANEDTLEGGNLGEQLLQTHTVHRRPAAKRQQRQNYCSWLLARFNICAYIDSIKSYEAELRIWNRRVNRLKRKAEKSREKGNIEGQLTVVEPSRQVIRDQLKSRLQHERAGSKKRHSRNISLLSSASQITEMAVDGVGSLRRTSLGKHYPTGTLESNSSQKRRSLSPNLYNADNSSPQLGLSAQSRRDSRSRGFTSRYSVMLPWDDSPNYFHRTLLSPDDAVNRQTGDGDPGDCEPTASGDSIAAAEDDCSYLIGDESSIFDDVDDGRILGQAGFDDILRYAVDKNERASAFVTFRTLTATLCAAQSSVDRPLKMAISLAPDFSDVLWENLGLSLPMLALFTWVIRALLFAIVLVFGVVSASLAALTNLQSLQHVLPWLKVWLTNHTEWNGLVQQISPMAMVILFNLVPPILKFIIKLQRRRSLSETHIEFFRIYYYFLLIQVFLFYIIAGGLLQNIRKIVDNPLDLLSQLGKALQTNYLFFLRFFVTKWFLLTFDLLRVSDIALAFIRGMFISSRTRRERRTPCCGWHTLDHPHGGQVEKTLCNIALCFSIALSYSVICPLISVLAMVYFSVCVVVYRNQILYVYTKERESFGILFPHVFRALITGVIIFQLLMIGIFLVTGSPTSVTLLAPLLIVTLSFLLFCENAYGNASRFLPLGDAAELDIMNGPLMAPVKKYRHPSNLAPHKLEPESLDLNPSPTVIEGNLATADFDRGRPIGNSDM